MGPPKKSSKKDSRPGSSTGDKWTKKRKEDEAYAAYVDDDDSMRYFFPLFAIPKCKIYNYLAILRVPAMAFQMLPQKTQRKTMMPSKKMNTVPKIIVHKWN